MEVILKKILKATTTEEVSNIIEDVFLSQGADWRNVGDRDVNWGSLGIGTDPAAGLVERITNSFDAVLEKEMILNPIQHIDSPRMASEKFFNIDKGRLHNIKNPNDKRIEKLKDKVVVAFQDSDNPKKPTVEIRDKGIGLKSEDFKNTILSLNQKNKLNKLHLMGAFGQGGSTSMAFNNYTIIVSKKFSKNNDNNEVSFTIVRVNEGDLHEDKLAWYEYLVDKSTGNPFYCKDTSSNFEPGTLVRHINMDLPKYSGNTTTAGNSLWYLTHHYLFSPIMPFSIKDERKDYDKINRTITGNSRLLTHSKNTEYYNSVEHTFKSGKANIHYWVLKNEGDKPRERIKFYTTIRHPIIITFNGQKQGEIDNNIIKNDLKMPYIDRYLIVHLEADKLDNQSLRNLFNTSREQLKKTSVYTELRELIIETLDGDQKLKELNYSRKENYFSASKTDATEKVRVRLAKRVNVFLSAGGKSIGGGGGDSGDRGETKPVIAIPTSDPPTFIEIKSNSPKEIYPNKMIHLKFQTDAEEHYIARPETFVALVNPIELCSYSGSTKVKSGHGTAYFKASENAEIGSEGEITLEIRPPNHKVISSTVKFKVVEPKEKLGGGKGKRKIPNITPLYIYKNSRLYKDEGWSLDSVAKVAQDPKGITIYVNGDNKNLSKLIERASRKNNNAVENIKNKYLEHICFNTYVQHKNYEKMGAIETDNEEHDIEKLKQYELINSSETVCGMINDMFETIIIESQED